MARLTGAACAAMIVAGSIADGSVAVDASLTSRAPAAARLQAGCLDSGRTPVIEEPPQRHVDGDGQYRAQAVRPSGKDLHKACGKVCGWKARIRSKCASTQAVLHSDHELDAKNFSLLNQ